MIRHAFPTNDHALLGMRQIVPHELLKLIQARKLDNGRPII